jgi:Transposase, Mutator family
MNELKSRGISDILIAVVDGLKGFPEAINAVFPLTVIQTCIVHLIRHSLEFVSWKDRKLVVLALKAIYRAKNAEAGLKALAEFETSFWGQRYPAIAQSWQRNLEHVLPFYAYPESVRSGVEASLTSQYTSEHFQNCRSRRHLLDEPLRQRLGQRRDGELLLVTEDRAYSAQNLSDADDARADVFDYIELKWPVLTTTFRHLNQMLAARNKSCWKSESKGRRIQPLVC